MQQNEIITIINKSFKHKIALKNNFDNLTCEVTDFNSWASIVGNGRLIVIYGNYNLYCKPLYKDQENLNKISNSFKEIIYTDGMDLDFQHIKVKSELEENPRLYKNNSMSEYLILTGDISCEVYIDSDGKNEAEEMFISDQIDQVTLDKDYLASQKRSINMTNINVARPNLKIATILDEFSYECFKYECTLIPLFQDDCKLTIENKRPDLLFVESAWKGSNGSWKYNISNYKSQVSERLIELINYCKELKIPTVFWNKEDPVHFENFIETAKLFDYIFTTDSLSIEKYKEVVGHNRVYLLPFAAQLILHNPINKDKEKLGKVAFAGTWYNTKYLNRQKDMEMLLNPAIKYGVDIYDRCYNYENNKNYRFPDIYQPYIKGNLPYDKMIQIYKKYDVFLNVNTVQESPTMFSRRVFELLACGTNIVSGYSLGLQQMFKGIVKLCRSKEDALRNIKLLLGNQELRDRLSLLGQRAVFNKHTYSHRMDTILDKVGLRKKKIRKPGVSIISYTNSSQNLDGIFSNYDRQSYEKKELIIIINNDNVKLDEWENEKKEYKDIKILKLGEGKSLNEYLAKGVEQSSFDFIAKFDENAYYASEYLKDIMNAFKYTGAGIVGKYTSYTFFERSKTLALIFPDMENRYVKQVISSTVVCKKELFNKIRFNDLFNEQDRQFLSNCILQGIKIYAVDRFNHLHITYDYDKSNMDEDYPIKYHTVTNVEDYISHVTV